jgi:hypothetical protein
MGRSPGVREILVAVMCFALIPLLLIPLIWLSRRRNKLATYVFHSEGMHASGSTFSVTIKWTAIPRVRQSKRFLFVFTSPIAAHALPLGALKDQGVLEAIRKIADQHTDLR